ncbi:lysophospholipase [Candidatus Nitrososphaera evergladensis SR1]|uniref:Lysophospholipase n=1 Tax=Candidatus Nitrososphaera evergladensis SR1 TaxID=1459636 RepID=A0A075MNZ7_9ARCH|nr:alpha/beta fold hydrolase [Candidatus Nitrososphaera evergladensis]AIF82938.1 lysophospholipase [Candidatus Nitrososphaera evergladensis SR1]
MTCHYQTASGKINVFEFPSQNPKNDTILCIHGIPSNARIFTYVGTKLSQAGYNVLSMDLPGHGGSEGPRGDVDFEKCLQSINQIVADLKRSGSRVFIMAHSMGSTFALWYAHSFKNSVDGLIIMCPYIHINNIKRSDTEPSAGMFLYLLLRRILTPRSTADMMKVLPQYAKVSGEEFEEVVRKKMINTEYSYRFLVDVLATRNSKVAELADIVDPILLLHGQKDRNVYPQVSEEYLKMLRSQNKELKMFDCDHWFYDAMFFNQDSPKYSEESRIRFISTIRDWLSSFR